MNLKSEISNLKLAMPLALCVILIELLALLLICGCATDNTQYHFGPVPPPSKGTNLVAVPAPPIPDVPSVALVASSAIVRPVRTNAVRHCELKITGDLGTNICAVITATNLSGPWEELFTMRAQFGTIDWRDPEPFHDSQRYFVLQTVNRSARLQILSAP